MKTADIVLRLMELLPGETSYFTESYSPESVSVSGTTVTITKEAHGLTNGVLVSIHGSLIENSITNIDDSGDGVVFTTAQKHDLSLCEYVEQDTYNSCQLASATDPSIDGEYTLTEVADRNTFSIASFPDTALTDVKLLEERSYSVNGLFSITYIDVDNFSFELDYTPPFDYTIVASSMSIHYSLRIRGASSLERVISNYNRSAANKIWGYVVLGDVVSNKSIFSNTDADMEMGGTNAWNATMLCPFAFYVFIPELTTTDGLISRDLAEDMRQPIYKSILGASFDTGMTHDAQSVTAPAGDGVQEADLKAFYVHRFDFVQNMVISDTDTSVHARTRAIELIQFDFLNITNDNGRVIASTIANLDAES